MKANAYIFETDDDPTVYGTVGLEALCDIVATIEKPVVIWVSYGTSYWKGKKHAPKYTCWVAGCDQQDDEDMMICGYIGCTQNVHFGCTKPSARKLVYCPLCQDQVQVNPPCFKCVIHVMK